MDEKQHDRDVQSQPRPPRRGDAIEIAGDYQYRALHEGPAAQRFWHQVKQLIIAEYLPPEKHDLVLDVGCGSGVISDYLGSYGAQVMGVDGNPDALAFARDQFKSNNVTFVQGHVDESFEIERPADKIYCLEVIEHIYLEQGQRMLRTFHDLLKPGGYVFLTTPNYRSFWPLIEWSMDRFSHAAHMDQDQHVTHYHPHLLKQVAERSGFIAEKTATTCFLAPWLATASARAAKTVHTWETRFTFVPGSVILAVLRKPGD